MYLSLSDMAERLGCCAKTFRRHVLKQGIPHIRLGKRLLFDPNRVELYLETIQMEKAKLERQGYRRMSREVTKYDVRLGL